jgi:hypothetical protein
MRREDRKVKHKKRKEIIFCSVRKLFSGYFEDFFLPNLSVFKHELEVED